MGSLCGGFHHRIHPHRVQLYTQFTLAMELNVVRVFRSCNGFDSRHRMTTKNRVRTLALAQRSP